MINVAHRIFNSHGALARAFDVGHQVTVHEWTFGQPSIRAWTATLVSLSHQKTLFEGLLAKTNLDASTTTLQGEYTP